MNKVSLLDCTLRDGGFLNDWNFGNSSILNIFRRLVKSNVDIIEVGFLDARRTFDFDRSMNPDTQSFNKIFKNESKGSAIVVGMIDFGTCPIENIQERKDSFLDGIRVIFKKKNMIDAIELCRKIKEKGYLVFVQPVSITTYTDREMLDLIDLVNDLNPFAMSLVDTYGLLHKDRLFKYFYLLDNNLNKDIQIGYHAHNNFQLAYANAIELTNIKTDRSLILDSSLYGMGKSAGNCNTELLADYLNNNYYKNYDLLEILNIIDMEILKYLKVCSWGYQMTYSLSALYECHPNYVKYLEKKNSLPVREIAEILTLISGDKKLSFDEEHIETLYIKYRNKKLNDTETYSKLKELMQNSTVLLLGPGRSIKQEHDKIQNFITENKVTVFSVNHINSLFCADYIFISNAKRYDQFIDFYEKHNNKSKLIITNNIMQNKKKADFILNFSKLSSTESIIGDSSLYLLMKVLIKLNVKKVILAGFDGFSKYTQNYYDDNLQFYNPTQNTNKITKAVNEQLQEFQKVIDIQFLTKSHYQHKEALIV